MFRFGARLISVGSKRYKKNNPITTNVPSNLPSYLRSTQSLSQLTTTQISSTVNRSTDDSTPQTISIINHVQDLGFNADEIKTVILSQPDLIKKSPALWNSVLGSLVCCGMDKKDILSILVMWPDVLFLKKSELDKTLQAWFQCGFGEELTFNILRSHPYFLKVNHATVQTRVKKFQIYFESKKRVGKMLLLAPNSLIEDEVELLDKLNYLDELCTEKSYIVSTGVLAHSTLHIMTRLEFLIRAGIYKRPGKEFNRKLCNNPKLTNIVNTTDEEFVSQVAKLSLLEFEVFREMFEKEYEESKNQDLDSDDDDDNEEVLNKLSFAQHRKLSRR